MKRTKKLSGLDRVEELSGDVCRPDRNAVFRFAPSPNGLLHLGHAHSALTNYEMAKAAGSKLLLRIEDIDTGRSRPEFVAAIFEDLAWLGIEWEQEVVYQSDRFDLYREAAEVLENLGVLYPCFASRQELALAAEQADGAKDEFGGPLYFRVSRGLTADDVAARKTAGQPFAMRLNMTRAVEVADERLGGEQLTFIETNDDETCRRIDANPGRWGDEVIVRKDTPASYHLAVVVDDAAQGVTNVTRGTDLYAATHLHRLLQVLLDLPEPVYHHHQLIVDDDMRKLSKSDGDLSLAALRAQGVAPNVLCDHLEEFLESRKMSFFSWS